MRDWLLPLLLVVQIGPIGPACRNDRTGQRTEDRLSRAQRLATDVDTLERRVEGMEILRGALLWDSLTRGEPGRMQALLPISSELVTEEQLYALRQLENNFALPKPGARRRWRYLRNHLTWLHLQRSVARRHDHLLETMLHSSIRIEGDRLLLER